LAVPAPHLGQYIYDRTTALENGRGILLASEQSADEGTYANLGGIRTKVPPTLTVLLKHIIDSHSQELDRLSGDLMTRLESDLVGTRLGDGLSTIVAILQLSETHLRDESLVPAGAQARRDLYQMAFTLLQSLVKQESKRIRPG